MFQTFSIPQALASLISYVTHPSALFRLFDAKPTRKNPQVFQIQLLKKFSAQYKPLDNGFSLQAKQFSYSLKVTDRIEVELECPKPWFMSSQAFEAWQQGFLETQMDVLHHDLQRIKECAPKKIALTGSSGLIGSSLKHFLLLCGCEVISLTQRRPKKGEIFYDPETKILSIKELGKIDGLIHLAGENLDGIWTKKKKEKIVHSRLQSTQFFVDAFQDQPLSFFLCASAIGIYAEKNTVQEEEGDLDDHFLANLCKKWEEIAHNFAAKKVLSLRFGVILSKSRGAFRKLKLPLRFHLGLTSHHQTYLSWITLDDAIYSIVQAMQETSIKQTINITSSQPILIEDFYRTLSRVHQKKLLYLPLRWFTFGEKLKQIFRTQQIRSKYPLVHYFDEFEKAARQLYYR